MNFDTWQQQVADEKSKGNAKAVAWLTASWMMYPLAQRQAARNGPAKASDLPTVEVKHGRIVFHSSVKGQTVTE
jgi:hypothetical protein